MPYNSTSDLPDSIKNNLPKHAREIYQAAYNSAWNEYKNANKRRGNDSRESVSHQVAWSAVEKKYEKGDDGKWHKK